jgi:hypothetical protein
LFLRLELQNQGRRRRTNFRIWIVREPVDFVEDLAHGRRVNRRKSADGFEAGSNIGVAQRLCQAGHAAWVGEQTESCGY